MKKLPMQAFGIERFLRNYWQKKPLVLRGAAPALATALGRGDLIDLACRDDAESRLVIGTGRRWQVRHGPFRRRDFAQLPARNWTLLVNGVDTLVPAARRLQIDFGFIPYARQDDVMVSYAAPGGGVGPHFDSYDVFLLQGAGTRRWQIGNQRDLTLIEGAPLKILRRFQPAREMIMQSGDLLYLPPSYAHDGVAIGECLTWSIGMRAPGKREFTSQFLDYLQDHIAGEATYSDPGLKLRRHRAEIGPGMRNKVRAMIAALRWNDNDIDLCLGEMLSEPRQSAVFAPPPPRSAAAFARDVRRHGLHLDLKSRMLFAGNTFFINGESCRIAAADGGMLRALADDQQLAAGTRISAAAMRWLHRWYSAGYLRIGSQPGAIDGTNASTRRKKPVRG